MKKIYVIDTTNDEMIELTDCIYSIKNEKDEKFLYVIGRIIGAIINEYKCYDELLDKETQYIFITKTF